MVRVNKELDGVICTTVEAVVFSTRPMVTP